MNGEAQRSGVALPHDAEVRHFHITGWAEGSTYGVLTVASDELTFAPARMGRLTSRLSGRLVHRQRTVVLISSPLNLYVLLRADAEGDMLTVSLRKGHSHNLANVTVAAYPWQLLRMRRAIRNAGFVPEIKWRFVALPWQAFD